MVHLYEEHILVATHLRQGAPGARSTVTDHLPPEAQAWQLHDVQWCLREAKRVGPSCSALVLVLFGDRVLIKLRAVQGLLRFAQQYSDFSICCTACCKRHAAELADTVWIAGFSRLPSCKPIFQDPLDSSSATAKNSPAGIK